MRPDLADNGRKVACGGVGEGRCRCREALQAARGAEAEARARIISPRLKAAA